MDDETRGDENFPVTAKKDEVRFWLPMPDPPGFEQMSPVAQQIIREIQRSDVTIVDKPGVLELPEVPLPAEFTFQDDSDNEFVPFVPDEPGRYPTPRISREEGRRIIDELREKYPEHWS